MKGKETVVLIRMGADAAEVDHFFYAGCLNRLFVGAGDLRDLCHHVEVGVEEPARREEAINDIRAGKGSRQKVDIFNIADGGSGAKGLNFCLFAGIAADDGDRVTFLQKFAGEWPADMT